jgi:hypothetical protein
MAVSSQAASSRSGTSVTKKASGSIGKTRHTLRPGLPPPVISSARLMEGAVTYVRCVRVPSRISTVTRIISVLSFPSRMLTRRATRARNLGWDPQRHRHPGSGAHRSTRGGGVGPGRPGSSPTTRRISSRVPSAVNSTSWVITSITSPPFERGESPGYVRSSGTSVIPGEVTAIISLSRFSLGGLLYANRRVRQGYMGSTIPKG